MASLEWTRSGHVYRSGSGKLVIDSCPNDAEHFVAPPEPYDPNNVGNWRRRCRLQLEELFIFFEGKDVVVVVSGIDHLDDGPTLHLTVKVAK